MTLDPIQLVGLAAWFAANPDQRTARPNGAWYAARTDDGAIALSAIVERNDDGEQTLDPMCMLNLITGQPIMPELPTSKEVAAVALKLFNARVNDLSKAHGGAAPTLEEQMEVLGESVRAAMAPLVAALAARIDKLDDSTPTNQSLRKVH